MKRLSTLFVIALFFSLSISAVAQQPNRDRNQAQQILSDEQLQRQTPDGVVVVPNIPYREGHERWKLDLAMPKAKGDKPRAAIVFVHGGGWRSGDKRRGIFLRGALDYASKGYVCITVNYRLTGHASFPACVEDVKTAVRWLRAHAEKYNVDPDRIGAFGNSAGAHLVSMLGLVPKDAGLEGDGPWKDQSSVVNAVCAAATPTDFPNWPKGLDRLSSRRGLLAGPAESLKQRAQAASPISYVDADMPPFLLIHGAKDGTVAFSQAESFVKAAKMAGAKDITLLKFDAAGHGVYNQHRDKTFPAMEKFFARTIGN